MTVIWIEKNFREKFLQRLQTTLPRTLPRATAVDKWERRTLTVKVATNRDNRTNQALTYLNGVADRGDQMEKSQLVQTAVVKVVETVVDLQMTCAEKSQAKATTVRNDRVIVMKDSVAQAVAYETRAKNARARRLVLFSRIEAVGKLATMLTKTGAFV